MLTSTEVWTCTSLHFNHTLNPGVPVFTEGMQSVRTTTNVRGCIHRNNSSVTTVTVHNSDWQQEESDNMETLTIHNTLQPQSERESWPYFTTLKPCHSSPLTKTMSLFDFPMTPGSHNQYPDNLWPIVLIDPNTNNQFTPINISL